MYRRVTSSWKRNIDFIILDIIVLSISYFLSYTIRHGIHIMAADVMYRDMYIIMSLLLILVGFFLETYHNTKNRGFYREFVEVFKQATLFLLLSVSCLYFLRLGDGYSRVTMLLTGIIYGVLTYIVRILWKAFIKTNKYFTINLKTLFVITTSDALEKVLASMDEQFNIEYKICGVALLDVDQVGDIVYGVPIVANKETVVAYTSREWVDEVFVQVVKNAYDSNRIIDELITMGITVHISLAEYARLLKKKQFVEYFGDNTVLTTSLATASFRVIFLKRLMDIVGGVVGSIIACLLAIIIGPLIYIKSPGPIFFKQERVGKNGKKFYMYKFRSMYLDAEKCKAELMEQNIIGSSHMFKIENDPRIIGGLGHFIRNYSIDEWPQFFNILAGDMSLVGTRPPTVDEWDSYELHHRVRLATKPGLTGLWQVSGRSQITDFEEVVKLDLQYITDWNLGLDIKILLKTVLVVVTRKGAA
ncbi:MAG: sugar transferase [Lachnospiraceae bacterium]